MFARAAAGAGGEVDTQCPGGGLETRGRAERPAAGDRLADGPELAVGEGLVDQAAPVALASGLGQAEPVPAGERAYERVGPAQAVGSADKKDS